MQTQVYGISTKQVKVIKQLLDKLQKRIYRTVSPSLAASPQPLAHRRNVASLSFSTGITLGSTSLFSREDYSLFW